MVAEGTIAEEGEVEGGPSLTHDLVTKTINYYRPTSITSNGFSTRYSTRRYCIFLLLTGPLTFSYKTSAFTFVNYFANLVVTNDAHRGTTALTTAILIPDIRPFGQNIAQFGILCGDPLSTRTPGHIALQFH